jgi:hypothetical protein
MRSLIIVRTHRPDAASFAAFDLFAGVQIADVIFGLDERRGAINTQGRASVGYTDAKLAQMGLYAHPDCGWRCGDYIYFTARAARPNYDFYWLVEPDVRIHTNDLTAFFAQFARNEADLLGARFGPRDGRWEWSGTIARTGLKSHGCLFPMTRLSGRAIDHVLAERKRCSADPALRDPTGWPNDEAFVASALATGGFDCADFNQGGVVCYNNQSLSIGSVVDYSVIQETPADGLIYHPVRDFGDWLGRAEARILALSERKVEPKNAARLRSEASLLSAVADACLKHPRYGDASLMPLMLAQPRWNTRLWAESMPHVDEVADTHRAKMSAAKLQRRFGVSDGEAQVATAHLATCNIRAGSLSVAAASDFDLGPAFPMAHFPTGFALPYAFDLAAKELLFTTHIRLNDVLAESFLYMAQRERARVVLRAPLNKLNDIYGPPDFTAKPVLIFSIGRTGSTLLEKLISCVTRRSISEPDTVTQLATNRAILAALPPGQRRHMMYYAIAPFFHVFLDDVEDGRCVIKFRSHANSIGEMLARAFPKAKFVFMLRDRQAWAKSTYRAFKLRPDHAVDRLVAGVKALHQLSKLEIDLTVISYEEIVADPQASVARLMDVDVAGDPALRTWLETVMSQDSQQNLRISRDNTAKPADGETDWIRAFEQAWASKRPANMLTELKLSI